jgi:hypothetical protein
MNVTAEASMIPPGISLSSGQGRRCGHHGKCPLRSVIKKAGTNMNRKRIRKITPKYRKNSVQ